LRFQGTCYRGHDPKWAFSPVSGEGARTKGGRFNPRGTPALYLSLTVECLFIEMGHGFSQRFSPLTVCAYEVDVKDIIDLRTERGRRRTGVGIRDMACAWANDLADNRQPASWRVVQKLLAVRAAGILVTSFANGARSDLSNLVLWIWTPDLPHRVRVHDPDGLLPKDQSSWRASDD
jgi:RES domain-containing protein